MSHVHAAWTKFGLHSFTITFLPLILSVTCESMSFLNLRLEGKKSTESREYSHISKLLLALQIQCSIHYIRDNTNCHQRDSGALTEGEQVEEGRSVSGWLE
ncbi:hypothetical protein WMY93_010642 [Mugilogobius chulae]|uniref:Secreted protein n=1 Tax=Mugilogobius chulae TaxID=88201 RepID=A0AAW0P814_9GOBI